MHFRMLFLWLGILNCLQAMDKEKYYIQALQHENQPVIKVSKKCIQRNKIFKELLKLTNQEENSRENPLVIPFNKDIPIKTIESFLKNYIIKVPKNLPCIAKGKSKDRILKKMYDRLCLAIYTQNHKAETKALTGILKIFESCNWAKKVYLAQRLDKVAQERKELACQLLVRALSYQWIVDEWCVSLEDEVKHNTVAAPSFNFEHTQRGFTGRRDIQVAPDKDTNKIIETLYDILLSMCNKDYCPKMRFKNAVNQLYNDNIIAWNSVSHAPLLFLNKNLLQQGLVRTFSHNKEKNIIVNAAINPTGNTIVSADRTGTIIVWLKNKYDDILWQHYILENNNIGYYKLYFFSENLIGGVGRDENTTFIKFWHAYDQACVNTFVINTRREIQALACYQDNTRCIAYDYEQRFYEFDLLNSCRVSTWRNSKTRYKVPHNAYTKLFIDPITGNSVSGHPYILCNKDHTILINLAKECSKFIPMYFDSASNLIFKHTYDNSWVMLKAQDIQDLQSMLYESNNLTLAQAVRYYKL